MIKRMAVILVFGSLIFPLAGGQALNPPETAASTFGPSPADRLAEEMAKRLSDKLHVRTVIGEPVKVGSITLIPIMMMDVNFGGGEMTVPGSPAGATAPKQAMAVNGFYMSGEARPLGFVAIGRKGTRFISAVQAPVK